MKVNGVEYMLFNSYIFILLFLPICLSVYFILNHFKKYQLANVFLLIMSLWFYGYFNYNYLSIIISSILVNFGIYKGFQKCNQNCLRKLLLGFGIAFNIGLIFYFKYFNFFIDNINILFKTGFNVEKILLPLGISFFTFQQLSFVIDAYRREVKQYSFLEYAMFVTYFPQLIAGPIVTHDELIPQFQDKKKRKFNWENFSKGVYIFILGLAKKVLIADILGNAVNIGFGDIIGLNTSTAIVVMLAYTLQIYFDFSGYCDMAIGLGKMMNIDLPVNFNSPYKSLTIVEFWKRWHMTLTRFFTKYIYIPLGGNKKGNVRTYANIMIVFLASGLWHGANWTFIVWGLLHGLFSVITRIFKKQVDKMPKALSWMITFLFINVTWIIFRADSLSDAFLFMKKILSLNFTGISMNIIECFNLIEFTDVVKLFFPAYLIKIPTLLFVLYFVISLLIVIFSKNTYEKMKEFKPSIKNLLLLMLLSFWAILSFTNISTFLYFNF